MGNSTGIFDIPFKSISKQMFERGSLEIIEPKWGYTFAISQIIISTGFIENESALIVSDSNNEIDIIHFSEPHKVFSLSFPIPCIFWKDANLTLLSNGNNEINVFVMYTEINRSDYSIWSRR